MPFFFLKKGMRKNRFSKSPRCSRRWSATSPRKRNSSASWSATQRARRRTWTAGTRSCAGRASGGVRRRWCFGVRWACVRGWLFGMLFSSLKSLVSSLSTTLSRGVCLCIGESVYRKGYNCYPIYYNHSHNHTIHPAINL